MEVTTRNMIGLRKHLLMMPVPSFLDGAATSFADKIRNEVEKSEAKEKTEHLPIEPIRKPLRDIVQSIADATQSPIDYVIGSLFSVASVALGYKVMMPYKIYNNHPNLAVVFIGKSTAGKSQPLKMFVKPLEEAQIREYEAYKQWYKDYKDNGCKGEKLIRKRYYVSDFTPESLQRDEVQNSNGLLAYDDEISGLFSALRGRYTKNSSFQSIIKMLDCSGIDVSRRGDDVGLSSDHSFLSIVGTTQPGLLPGMISKDLLSSGLAARFLFIYPEPRHKVAQVNTANVDMSVWTTTVNEYLNMSPTELQMSSDAEHLYMDFWQEMQDKAENEPDTLLAPIYGKMQIHVLKWSMIAHFLCSQSLLPQSNVIEASEMSYSIECMKFLLSQWIKTYLCIKGVEELPKTDNLIKMIYRFNPQAKQTDVANVLNKSQQYVSKIYKQTVK